MDGVESRPVEEQNSPLKSQIFFRLLAIVESIAAALIMMTNKQSVVVYGINLHATYRYSDAFRHNLFFAVANIVVFVFSVASLILVFYLIRNGSKPNSFFFMFLHDLMTTLLMGAACMAATTFGYIGKYGNPHIGWMGICNHFHRFCDRATTAIALSYVCFVTYLFLTILSAHKSRNL